MKLLLSFLLFSIPIQSHAEWVNSEYSVGRLNQNWSGTIKFTSEGTTESSEAYEKIKITAFCGADFCEKILSLSDGVNFKFKKMNVTRYTSIEVAIPISGMIQPIPYIKDLKNKDASLTHIALDQGRYGLSLGNKIVTLECESEKQCRLEFNKVEYYEVNLSNSSLGIAETFRRWLDPANQPSFAAFSIGGPEAVVLAKSVGLSTTTHVHAMKEIAFGEDAKLSCSFSGHSWGCAISIAGKTIKDIIDPFNEWIWIAHKVEIAKRVLPISFKFESKGGMFNIVCNDADGFEVCTAKVSPTGK